MNWRLLLDSDSSASRHMAVDEAVSVCVRKGRSQPTLRIYTWTQAAVTIGYFQKIEKEINLPFCREEGLEVVRRTTGGRAVLHGAQELTYSFSAPCQRPFDSGLHATYAEISRAFIAGLERLGIQTEMTSSRKSLPRAERTPLCFQALSYAEVSVEGRKIIGSAQKRWPNGFMQQGSIPLSIPRNLLFEVLRFPSSVAAESARGAVEKKMAGLWEYHPGLAVMNLEQALRKGFETHFGIRMELGTLSAEEEETAYTLSRKRYGSAPWNLKR